MRLARGPLVGNPANLSHKFRGLPLSAKGQAPAVPYLRVVLTLFLAELHILPGARLEDRCSSLDRASVGIVHLVDLWHDLDGLSGWPIRVTHMAQPARPTVMPPLARDGTGPQASAPPDSCRRACSSPRRTAECLSARRWDMPNGGCDRPGPSLRSASDCA
jgi:hypothetical protein